MNKVRGYIRAFFGDGTPIESVVEYDGQNLVFHKPVSVNSIKNNSAVLLFEQHEIVEINYRCTFKYLDVNDKPRYICPVTKIGSFEYDESNSVENSD